MSQGVMQSSFWELVGTIVLTIAFFFHGDAVLWVFSLMVFYVCGVPWELQNWRNRQEFMNAPEEEG